MHLSLRAKLIAILVLAGVLPLLFCLLVLGTFGYRQVVSSQGQTFQNEASNVAKTLQVIVERDVRSLGKIVGVGGVTELVAQLSGASAPSSPTEVRKLDQLWPSLLLEAPEIQSSLSNPLADRLRLIKEAEPNFAEILVTDRQGRLIAATGKTSDFDQSDECWWMNAMRLKPGQATLGGLHFDPSAETYSLDIGIPISDPNEPRHPIGVLKAVVDVGPLLAAAPFFTTDVEDRAIIVENTGKVLMRLSHPDFVPDGRSIARKAVAKLTPHSSGWFISPLETNEPEMTGFAPCALTGVFTPSMGIDGPPFYVLVFEPSRSVLAPLRLRAGLMAGVGVLIIAAFAWGGFFFAKRHITRPVESLRIAAAALAESARAPHESGRGTPEQALLQVSEIRTGDEMEELAHDFSTMAHRLMSYQADLKFEIAAKTLEIRRDLDMAREFQRAFLPRSFPHLPHSVEHGITLNFHHVYQAAMTVSGDFFDVLKLSDHRVGVLVADVMGHGTRSALVTAILRTLLHGLAETADDPTLFLARLNEHFYQAMRQTEQLIFVSACYVVIDTHTLQIQCASAGHPSPLVGNRISGKIEPLFSLLKNNPALGLFPTSSYDVFRRPLKANDIVLLFTDGVLEAMNSADEEFGRARLLKSAVANLNGDLAGLTNGIIATLTTFVGHENLSDDICLVAVEAVALPEHQAIYHPLEKMLPHKTIQADGSE